MLLKKESIWEFLISMFCVLFFVLNCMNCTPADKQRQSQVKILIVYSYHIEYPWTHAIDDGIMEVLKDKGFNIKTFFMDTKRNTGEDYKIDSGRRALKMVEQFEPDIVITTDDNAQKYVGKYLVNNEKQSVVFCGVNDEISKYGYPGNNVTGIRERPYIRSSLELLKKIVPNAETYTVLTDGSPTSSGFIEYLKSLNLPIRIDKIIETDRFEQWKKEVSNIESDAVITYLYHTVRHEGKIVLPEDVMAWTTANIAKPTVGFFDFAIQGGVLVGHVESGFEHGELAARKALQILGGKKTFEIPITTARKGFVMVNEATARDLGILIDPIRNIADKVLE